MSLVPLKRLASLVTSLDDRGELPVLTLDVIETTVGRLSGDGDVPTRPRPDSGVATVRPGDVLIGKLRPYLAKSLLMTTSAYASTELLALRPAAGLDSRYLAYVVQSPPFIHWTVATSEGTKMPRTSWEKVGQWRMHSLNISVQRAIADFLDAETARIDALIDSKHALRESLEERRSAVIELAVRELAATWGEQPLRFAATEITVGIVVTPAAWYTDEGVPAVRGLDVAEGRIATDDLVEISHEGHAVHRKSRLRAGDVVVVRTGQAGRAAVVPAQLDGANCIDLLVVRPGRDLDSKFLEFVLNSDWTQKYIERHSVGTIQSHFNVAGLRGLGVPRAPLSEQRAAVVEMTRATKKISAVVDLLKRQIALLHKRRQTVITAAVTGELDIPGVAA